MANEPVLRRSAVPGTPIRFTGVMNVGEGTGAPPGELDPRVFRNVLGRYPTGVSVVTGIDHDGKAIGLAVGTFTSVSLDPPLIGFLPARTSETWPKIERAGRFCVNVLSEHQEDVCRVFATKEPDKFRHLRWRGAPTGSPILAGAVAWIDCTLDGVHEAGDHYIVLGRVVDLGVQTPDLPLLFFQGGYGSFAPQSLASADMSLAALLPLVDLARPEMERIVRELEARCLAVAQVGSDMVMMASAGPVARGRADFIGDRSPMVPAAGTVFMAWAEDAVVDGWLAHVGSEAERAQWRERLAEIRRRGYSVGMRGQPFEEYERLLSSAEVSFPPERLSERARSVIAALPYDPLGFSPDDAPDVRSLHVPVFDAAGRVPLALSLFLPSRKVRDAAELERCAAVMVDAADRVTEAAGGATPAR